MLVTVDGAVMVPVVVVSVVVGLLVIVDEAVLVGDEVAVEVALVVGLVVGVVNLHPANVPSANPRIAPLIAATTSSQVSSSRINPPAVQPMFVSMSESNPCTTFLMPASMPHSDDVSWINALPFFSTQASSTAPPEHSSIVSANDLSCTSHRPRGTTKYVLPLKSEHPKWPFSTVVVGVDVIVLVAVEVAVIVGVVVADVVAVVL